MGFYRNGFVFTSEPAWQALATLPPEIGLTGYQHKNRNVWLLDAWTCPTRQKHWPFADELELAAPPVAAVEQTLQRICDAAGETLEGAGYLGVAAQFSTLLGIETFFFAANDLAGIPGVEVAEPVDVSNGQPMYGSVVALWPKAAGDPDETAGIGSFDPFLNLDRDFREVFSRPCGG